MGRQSDDKLLVGSEVLIENHIQEFDSECSDSWLKEVHSATTVQTMVWYPLSNNMIYNTQKIDYDYFLQCRHGWNKSMNALHSCMLV